MHALLEAPPISPVRASFDWLGRDLYVPVGVRRFRDPRILWMNERWLAGQGIAPGDEPGRAAIEASLLDQFGVGVPAPSEPEGAHVGGWRTLLADGYGSPGGATHGGSGRVGALGGLNAKGIGRTPLASDRCDWYHSHGYLWLEEAIREAINAEVAGRLFPLGAVPVVAIIDPDTRIHWGDGNVGARRAIVVRPNFLRVAVLLRSLFFGGLAEQQRDARRVRDAWHGLAASRGDPHALLLGAFGAQGRQAGFGRASRLWSGPAFASNLTFDGALVDFGSFRALPDWRRATGTARQHGFGDDAEMIRSTALALARGGFKHGYRVDADGLCDAFGDGAAQGFDRALADAGIDGDEAVALRAVYAGEQRQRAGLAPQVRSGASVVPGEAARRFRTPRSALFRETLLADTEALIAAMEPQGRPDRVMVERFIAARIAAALDPVAAVAPAGHPAEPSLGVCSPCA